MTFKEAKNYRASVIVTSDTCFRDPNKDESGQYVAKELERLGFSCVSKHIVPDERHLITECVKTTIELPNNVLTITVGGTGLCPRDVTPEATSVLYERHCNGISTALHMTSLRYSAHAALSRLSAGITGSCLIINFPGKLKACRECLDCAKGWLEHALEQVKFNAESFRSTHEEQDAADRYEKIISSTEELVSSPIVNQANYNLTSYASQEDILDSAVIQSGLEDTQDSNNESINIVATLEPAVIEAFHEPTVKFDIVEFQGKEEEEEQAAAAAAKEECQDVPLLIKIDSELCIAKDPITESPYPIVDYERALVILSNSAFHLSTEDREIVLDSVETACQAIGETTSYDIISKRLIPPFPVSTMDGYVLHVYRGVRKLLPNFGTINATLVDNMEEFEVLRKDPIRSTSFICYQVNTGGRVPEDDIAVVPFEQTGPVSKNNIVPIYKPKLDCHIRQPGSDLNHDDIIKKGTVIGPVELALILSMGHTRLQVVKKPVLGVLSTGDELAEFYSTSARVDEDVVIDTNGPLLSSLFKSRGFMVENCGISRDNKEDIHSKMSDSLFVCDVLVVTGGASMGTKDYVKDVIEDMGGVIHFGRINIKPGKPAAFASLTYQDKQKFIFALPGNPVSAYVTSTLLVIPFIEQGLRAQFGNNLPLSLSTIGELISVEVGPISDAGYEFDGRLEFLRAKLIPEKRDQNSLPLVAISIKQQSSRMLSLRDCDCLVIVNPSMRGSRLLTGQVYQALKLKS